VAHLASLLGLGFILGMRHSTDADHVVAVSTIVSREKRLGPACLLGVVWGLGHTLTIFAVGVAIIFLKLVIPARVGLSMEFAVGLMLVLLGALNVAGRGLGSLGAVEHEHAHADGRADHHHAGAHAHSGPGPHRHAHAHALRFGWLETAGHFQLWRSLCVGLVHGLAGSAAVALLVLSTIAEPRAAAVYLLVFGLGTLAGMLAISAAMETSMLFFARRGRAFERALTLGTGLLSLVFGVWVVYRIGFVDGLFLAVPRWTPQ
jgi:cytochrome c biogenesis protein CcdA